MSDKRKPIGERVAELMGRTSYRDIRDGIGGGFKLSLPMVAAQLGMIQQARGEVVVQALETYFGSTLMHERNLRHAWDAHCRKTEPNLDYETAVLARMGCALAIRQFAGIEYTNSSLAEYAWIIKIRPQSLRVSVIVAEDWLDEHLNIGLRDLRDAFSRRAA